MLLSQKCISEYKSAIFKKQLQIRSTLFRHSHSHNPQKPAANPQLPKTTIFTGNDFMSDFLQSSIAYIKGVGPQRAELLSGELKIFTIAELLNYFPFRYIDRTQIHRISQLNTDMSFAQLKGTIRSVQEVGMGHARRLSATLQDESGTIELVWFKGIKWVKPTLNTGASYLVFGRPTVFRNAWNMAHPELELVQQAAPAPKGLQPVYSTTEKLSARSLNSKGIEKIIKTVLPEATPHFPENLPQYLVEVLSLMPRAEAMVQIHAPQDEQLLARALHRLKFEELFLVQLALIRQKLINQKRLSGFVFETVGDHFNDFYHNHLPFSLTDDQKQVLKEIRKDLKSGHQMNRLLQGDVGSGKTIVALLSALIAADNGFQTALMAPTEILANQHFIGISELLSNSGLNVRVLSGSTKKSARTEIHQMLLDGSLHLLIGTHALIEDVVQFANLGLVIIDEQHRFGVAQRAKLWKKNVKPPHILVMTATPIPRTLAMTAYGDLDVSTIKQLPPGRKPIKTIHQFDSNRLKVFGFMQQQIAEGRQVYVVYPLIEESQAMDYKDLMDGFEGISRHFQKPQYQVSIVHGKMKAADKEFEMQRFVRGETHIMVATTVIEVGVNVPNASVMVIESAERFGLSQLHQLRGRVGRGADQAYCVLMTGDELSADARERIATMVKTNDGFEIAEVDLKLRGPGDIMGTRQSGTLDFALADIVKDQALVALAREKAIQILERDPELKLPEHENLSGYIRNQIRQKLAWSRIS
jgi:ATP-dependent DNA helicase RecG